jgi:hypothetical protein
MKLREMDLREKILRMATAGDWKESRVVCPSGEGVAMWVVFRVDLSRIDRRMLSGFKDFHLIQIQTCSSLQFSIY